jgi:hypothetical protein
MPEQALSTSVKTSTGPSTAIAPSRGTSFGWSAWIHSIAASEPITPRAPPRTESSTLAVSSWRRICRRVPPSATRTAISFSRASARASSRFATFAQAISSTKPTEPASTKSVRRTLPTTWSSRARC